MADSARLLSSLLGAWSLDRTLVGADARMHGRAVFAEEPGGTVLYREEGELVLATGYRSRAYRRYRFNAGADALLIDFADGPDDGRRFVALRFGQAAIARAVHRCGRDRYDVTWRLDLPGGFATEIAVTGPSKAYRAMSRFRRAAG